MNIRLRTVLTSLLLTAAACSGSPSSLPNATTTTPDAGTPSPVSDGGSPPDGGAPELDVRVEGSFARAAHPLPGGGFLLVLETPAHTRERYGRPLRALRWVDPNGREVAQRVATDERELLDATVHPSGEVTIVEASTAGYWLLRVDARANLLGETLLADHAVLTDPPNLGPTESRSPIEEATHDAAQLDAEGEGTFLASRTGRHSVVAYHLVFEGGAFGIRTRTLVVPAHPMTPTALTGGTYDTFGQLEGHYGVFVAVDPAGIGWVGVGHARMDSGDMVEAHEKVFGEKLVTDPDFLDVFVSRVSPNGTRLGTSVVSTENDEQLYALRPTSDGVFALGRTERWNAEGTGFDALVGHIDRSGVVTVKTLDVDRGDIAFDVVATPTGLLVAGASGYWQNPHGASISEESHTFVRLLRPDGSVDSSLDLEVPNGPRHSEARFILDRGGSWVIGGMLDGPGTHSADSDAKLLRATAFVTRRASP